MTALVSFDRIFEVLDLKPLIAERPTPGSARPVRDDRATGSAPRSSSTTCRSGTRPASEVSLASLESIALPSPERHARRAGSPRRQLRVAFGPVDRVGRPVGRGQDDDHGAGRRGSTTRTDGAVRIDGHDLRDLTHESLHAAVGVVTQDAHLFHDTLRANLLYARPAPPNDLIEACEAAQIWDLVSSLPKGSTLWSVTAATGYPGGEATARRWPGCCSRRPTVVVLDEATAHLDSESEVAVQRALKTALAGPDLAGHRASAFHRQPG